MHIDDKTNKIDEQIFALRELIAPRDVDAEVVVLHMIKLAVCN